MNFYDVIRLLAAPLAGPLAEEIHAAIDRHEAQHNQAAGVTVPGPAPVQGPADQAQAAPAAGEETGNVVP